MAIQNLRFCKGFALVIALVTELWLAEPTALVLLTKSKQRL